MWKLFLLSLLIFVSSLLGQNAIENSFNEENFIFLPNTSEISNKENSPQRFNLLLYSEEWTNDTNYLVNFLPFYNYQRNRDILQDNLLFWPLLAGYEVSRNPIPTTIPHIGNFEWYSIPLFSLGGSIVYPTESREVSSIVSFLLMTFSREIYVKDEYSSREWYSLPVLSFYHSETLFRKNFHLSNVIIGNPLFYVQDSQIEYKDQFFSGYEWAIHPLSLALGKDSFYIAYQGRWGRDRKFEILGCDGFSLFTISTTFSQYPGAEYQRFRQYGSDVEQGTSQLLNSKLSFPTTRLGFLYPFIMFETNPNAGFRWQILPLFHYYSEKEKYAFQILPLFLEINQEGLSFRPSPKFFPLIYHDEMYQRWDILWPLFFYQNNPDYSGKKLGCRFLFQYENISSIPSLEAKTNFSLVEGLLLSYNSSNSTNSQLEILPGGILFGYYETATEFQWRVLGCGYEDTPQRRSLQILFIKIPLQYKTK